MRRRKRKEYSKRRVYPNRMTGDRGINRFWNRLSAGGRALIIGGLLVLAACLVAGGVLCLLNPFAEDEKEPAFASQPIGTQANSTSPVVILPSASPLPTPVITESPRPTASGQTTQNTSRPVDPGSPTPEPTSNGHELDDELVIAIDAGHGGMDGGSSVGDILEKDINRAVADEIIRILEEHGGITVVRTREGDTFPSLQDRCDVANAAKCDYFVSIHCNSFTNASVQGLECYYNKDSDEGAKFAQHVLNELKKYSDMKIRSAHASSLAVTRHTYCPAILIEMGFLTNETDCKNLSDPDYQKKIAERIAKAVLKEAGL